MKLNNKIILGCFILFWESVTVLANPLLLIPQNPSSKVIKETAEDLEEIVIDQLEDIKTDNLGLAEDYDFNLWQNAEQTKIEALLNNLAPDFKINAFYKITKSLLTTTAKPPQLSKNFLLQRLKALMNMGMTNEVIKLIELAGLKNFNELYFPALLTENNDFCSKLNSSELNNLFYQKINLICNLQQKQNDQALLKVNLLRDSGYSEETFFNLIEYTAHASLVKPDADDLTLDPFNLTVALNSPELVKLLPETINKVWYDKILLANDNLPLETRIKKAEKALVMNIINFDLLAQLYLKAEFKSGELAASLTLAEKLTPEMGRALLYQAIQNRRSDFEKAEIIAKAFDLAKTRIEKIAVALFYNPIIMQMTFSKNLSWFFNYAGISMIYSGNTTNINDFLNFPALLKAKKSSLFWGLSRFLNIDYEYEISSNTFRCDALDEALLFTIEEAFYNHNYGSALLLITSSLGKVASSEICPASLFKVLSLLKSFGFEQEAVLIAYQVLIENSLLLNGSLYE